MREWISAELRRYRGWGLGLGLLHLVALLYLNRLTDLSQAGIGLMSLLGGVCAVIGLLLGAWQVWSYRRPQVWLQLLHRPVPPARLMLGLAAAAALVLAQMVLLPVALALLAMGWSGRLVEAWQLGLALHAWLIAVVAWLSAALAVLALGAWGCLFAAVPLLLLTEYLSLPWLLLPMLALMLWLLAGLAMVFQPDLERPPQAAHAQWLLGLPLILVLTLVLQLGLSVAAQVGVAAVGAHPQFQAPQDGGYAQLRRMTSAELVADGLRRSGTGLPPIAAHAVVSANLADMADMADTAVESLAALPAQTLYPSVSRAPQRFQPGGELSLSWLWRERQWRMEFSHAQQLYLAFDRQDRLVARLGQRGLLRPGQQPAAEDRLAFVPMPLGPWLALGPGLYRLDAQSGTLRQLLQLPEAQERFVAAPQPLGPATEGQFLLLSNRRVLLLAADGKPQWQAPLPYGLRDLSRVDVLKAGSGEWLLSLLHGAPLFPSEPRQVLLRVEGASEGTVHTLLDRPLAPVFSDAFSWIYWWVSPLQQELRSLLERSLQPAMGWIDEGRPSPRASVGMWQWALALMAVSALTGLQLARRRGASWSQTLGWCAVIAALGLPALGAAWLLLRPRSARAPAAMPSPRGQLGAAGVCSPTA